MGILKGTKSFYDTEISDSVAQNIKSMVEYGLLEVNAFTNFQIPNTYSRLNKINDREFNGLGAQWVWESGIESVDGTSPIQISGIYVNNNFVANGQNYTSGSLSASWIVDYRNGRVVFSTDMPTSTVVKVNHSIKDVAVYLSDSEQWKFLIDSYLQRFSTEENLAPSGMAQTLKKNRCWLPCVIIDTGSMSVDPYQLGGGELAKCGITYHIFSDNAFSAKRLNDLIVNQDERTINIYNTNTAPFSLKNNGSIPSGILTHKQLSSRDSPYFWTFADLEETNGTYIGSDNDLYRSEVRQVVSVYRYNSTY